MGLKMLETYIIVDNNLIIAKHNMMLTLINIYISNHSSHYDKLIGAKKLYDRKQGFSYTNGDFEINISNNGGIVNFHHWLQYIIYF